ncbi:MAG: NADH-quinone oxidoreductase subunit M [Sporichthyaceae bacterium]|nr:NADH-quinone oxidoreductase subunit M [Sporichthyaceae bacterium]
MSALTVALLALPLAGSVLLFAVRGRAGDALAQWVAVLVTGATLAVAVVLAVRFDYGAADRMQFDLDAAWAPALDLRFHLGIDGIALPLVVLTALLTFLCAIYSLKIVPESGRVRPMLALLLLLEVGMLGTFVALDLVLFFVFFETVLVPMYFLIADWGDPQTRRPAAYKFILYTLLGSAIMLLGLLVIYVQAGTFDMVALAESGGSGISHSAQVLGFLALLIGFGVKAPMWPLHTWLPDAHTAAPTIGSVLLAGVLLKMGTYGLVRIALPILPEGAAAFAPYLGALAVVGIIYGSLICLAQRDLKRLIAYSSVGHMGFVLLGIATLTPVGVNGALFANIAHGLITGLLFFLAGAIKDRHHSADMTVLGGGLYQRTPRLGGLLAFAAVASLGLPGLAGFWGELLTLLGSFEPAAELNRALFLVLMVLAGLGTLLTAVYLLVMLRRVAMGESLARWREPGLLGDVSAIEWVSWAPLVALIVLAGLWPRLLLGVTDPAVQALFGVIG